MQIQRLSDSTGQPPQNQPEASASTSASEDAPAAKTENPSYVLDLYVSDPEDPKVKELPNKLESPFVLHKSDSDFPKPGTRQTHFEFRPAAEVNKTTGGKLFNTHIKRDENAEPIKDADGKPITVREQLTGNKATLWPAERIDQGLGKRASEKAGDKTMAPGQYRMDSTEFRRGMGGSGLDEQIRTSDTLKIRDEFGKHFSGKDLDHLVGRMSMARTGTEVLGWTDIQKKVKKAFASVPGIASHPGGLSTDPGDFTHNIQGDHSYRDKERSGAVMRQFDTDKSKWQDQSLSHAEKLVGAKQSIENMTMVAKAYTTKVMMQPEPQLGTADVSKMTVAHHTRIKQVVGNQETGEEGIPGPGFDRWKALVHNNRERIKDSTAASLVKNGYETLVHPKMREHLQKYGNDPDWAVVNQNKLPSHLTTTSTKSEANFPPSPMSLDEMKDHNARNPQQPYYLIGPPRGIIPRAKEQELDDMRKKSVKRGPSDEVAGPSNKRPKGDLEG